MTWVLAAAAAFNLSCTGTYTTGLLDPGTVQGAKNVQVEHRNYTFRVDLNARRWCVDTCSSTEAIVEVSDREIVLARDKPARIPIEIDIRLNRESGSLFYLKRSGSFQELSQGTCEAKPFTNFPTQRF